MVEQMECCWQKWEYITEKFDDNYLCSGRKYAGNWHRIWIWIPFIITIPYLVWLTMVVVFALCTCKSLFCYERMSDLTYFLHSSEPATCLTACFQAYCLSISFHTSVTCPDADIVTLIIHINNLLGNVIFICTMAVYMGSIGMIM